MMDWFVIYCHPSDHPKHYVVRRWVIDGGQALPTNEYQLANTLGDARMLVPEGLVRIPREDGDDRCIVESWF